MEGHERLLGDEVSDSAAVVIGYQDLVSLVDRVGRPDADVVEGHVHRLARARQPRIDLPNRLSHEHASIFDRVGIQVPAHKCLGRAPRDGRICISKIAR